MNFSGSPVGDFHSVWGWVVVVILGVGGVWGLVLASIRREPPRYFWWMVAAGMGAATVQVALGVWAFAVDGIQPGNQHVFYGIVIAFTMAFAYMYRSQLGRRPALAYGLLMLFMMGLAIRGIMTFGHSF
ncbi:MAG: hypothetical protein KatS3mg011_1279 [Acidimicrobiia bacterium]|nr:MAG: hypothetical protein KatS3mg011_1279 [Acidimicrobiia bacterium]